MNARVFLLFILPLHFIACQCAKIEQLSLHKESEHFKVHCVSDKNEKAAADKILTVAEKNFARCFKIFKGTPKEKIDIKIYSNIQALHSAIEKPSAPDWLTASCDDDGYVLSTVSLNNPGSYHTSDSLLQLNIVSISFFFMRDIYTMSTSPRWLYNGVGLWLSEYRYEATLSLLAKDHTVIPTLEQLTSKNSIEFAKINGFECSCSLVAFIIQKWGWGEILALLADFSSFEKILGTSQEAFRNQWISYLDSTYLAKK